MRQSGRARRNLAYHYICNDVAYFSTLNSSFLLNLSGVQRLYFCMSISGGVAEMELLYVYLGRRLCCVDSGWPVTCRWLVDYVSTRYGPSSAGSSGVVCVCVCGVPTAPCVYGSLQPPNPSCFPGGCRPRSSAPDSL